MADIEDNAARGVIACIEELATNVLTVDSLMDILGLLVSEDIVKAGGSRAEGVTKATEHLAREIRVYLAYYAVDEEDDHVCNSDYCCTSCHRHVTPHKGCFLR